MLAKNSFMKTKKPKSTQHRILTRSCDRATRRLIFFGDFAKDLPRMYPLEVLFESSGQGTVLLQGDYWIPRENVELLREKTAVFGVGFGRIVLSLWQLVLQ
ncbi:hypothetical protein TNCV_1161941 [Trichonephila clavipes]|nr:hypothetical protein TNCV_1161941 [Trichonephila clavipes]